MSCKKCQDGYIYTCGNCGGRADYDYEFRAAFCDTCEILKEKYTVDSYECPECNKSENEDNENNKKYLLFFDTETTGLPKNWNAPISDTQNWPRLVQLAYHIYDDEGNFISDHDFIIYPDGYSIPYDSTEIHGISDEQARASGEPIQNVLSEFLVAINSSHTIIGHNINYDINVVGCEFIRNGLRNPFEKINKICTMESSTNFCAIDGPYGYKWPKLSELYFKLFGRYFDEAHDASVDIKATAECFWELVNKRIIFINQSIQNDTKPFLVPCFIENGNEKKYGYMYSETEKIAIKCQFDYTYPFKGDIAKVLYLGNINFITSNGVFIQPYDSFRGSIGFTKGLVAAKASRELNPLSTEKVCGYIDIESDEIIKIPFEYNDVHEFVDDFATVKKGNSWGLIDTFGAIRLNFNYQWLGSMKHGLLLAKRENKWGLIDIYGKEVLPIIYDTYLYRKNEPFHTVSKSGKYGFYDMKSNRFLGLNYDGASVYSEGCVAVEVNKKWGFLNDDLNEIIPFDYEGAKSFNEGYVAVKKGGKWGFINKTNKLIIPYSFKAADKFSNGFAQVEYPLSWRKKLQIFMTGKYERVLHRIDINGVSKSSWKSVIQASENQFL